MYRDLGGVVDGSNSEISENGEPQAQHGFWRGFIAGVIGLGAVLAVIALVISLGGDEQVLGSGSDEDQQAEPADDSQEQQAEPADDSPVETSENNSDPFGVFSRGEGPRKVAVTATGQVITSHTNIFRLWTPDDTETFHQTHTVIDRGDAFVVLSDGRVASGDGEIVYLWDPSDPDADPEVIDTQSTIRSLIALPDGRLLVVGFDGLTDALSFKIWDTTSLDSAPITINDPSADHPVWAALPDGRIAQGNEGRSNDAIVIWDPSGPEIESRVLGSHPDGFEHLAVLPDGRLASAGLNGPLIIWDLDAPAGGSEEISIPVDRGVRSMIVLPDGRLALRVPNNEIWFWDPASPLAPFEKFAEGDSQIRSITNYGDGRTLVGFRRGFAPVFFDLTTLDPAEPEPTPEPSSPEPIVQIASVFLAGHSNRVSSIAELSDGRLVSLSADQTIRTWDPANTNEALHVRSLELSETDPGNMLLMAVLPDDRVVIVESAGVVRVWDPNEPDAPFTLIQTPPRFGVVGRDYLGVDVLPDGRISVATDADGAAESTIFVVDPDDPNAEPILLVGLLPGRFRGVGLLNDGRIAAVSALGEVRVWDPSEPNAEPQAFPTLGQLRSTAILPNNRIATAELDIRISNLGEPGEPALVLDTDLSTSQSEQVVQITQLPDGRILSADTGGTLQILHPEQPGAERIVLPRRDEFTTRFFPPIEVLSEGRLAIGTEEGLIDIYDIGS